MIYKYEPVNNYLLVLIGVFFFTKSLMLGIIRRSIKKREKEYCMSDISDFFVYLGLPFILISFILLGMGKENPSWKGNTIGRLLLLVGVSCILAA